MKRYFEFVDGKSSKFWEVWVEGSTVYTRFGKIGANGQTTVKEFPSSEAAETGRDKSIAEKTKKGYLEVSRSEPPPGPLRGATSEKMGEEIVSNPFRQLVEEDTVEGWNHLRETEFVFEKDFSHLGLQQVDENGLTDLDISNLATQGLLWCEMPSDHIVVLGNDYFPYIHSTTALNHATDTASLGDYLDLYRAEKTPNPTDSYLVSFVSIVCPRCHISAITYRGFDEEETDWSDYEGSWVDKDCIACSGEGEWVWEIELGDPGTQETGATEKPPQETKRSIQSISCKKCGESLTPAAKFCSICGEEASKNQGFCTQCGASRGDGARFCGECGNKF